MGFEDKNIAFAIAPIDFRDEEYAKPRAALYASGAHIVTVSRTVGYCKGSRGSSVHADMALSDAVKASWDMVVFVGGNGADAYFDDPDALVLARAAVEAHIPLAAICIAPSILAHAGVLQGVRATAWADRREDLEAHGAVWVDSAVVLGESSVGSPIITACGPSAAFAFGQTLVGVLANG